MTDDGWIDVGAADELARTPLQEVALGHHKVALSCRDGEFGAISGTCNHVAGPLGRGTLDGDYVVCPWHYWKFHRATGDGEPGFEADRVPRHDVKVQDGRVLVRREASSKRNHLPHPPHALQREPQHHDGPARVLGISTTAMDEAHKRQSTSELLLVDALEHARATLGLETRLLRLSELSFRACEGF